MRTDGFVIYNGNENEFHTENGIVPIIPENFTYIIQEQFEEHREALEEMYPDPKFYLVPIELVKPLVRKETNEDGEETNEHNYESSMEFLLEKFEDLVVEIDYSKATKL